MKKAIYTLTVFLTIALLESCCCIGKPVCDTKIFEGIKNIDPNIDISQTEFIVTLTDKFPEQADTLAGVKDLLKDITGMDFNVESCRCSDLSRLLIKSDTPIINIEGTVGALGGNAGGQVEGELQFTYTLPDESGEIAVQTNKLQYLNDFVGERGNRINIAVIDTGIDLNQFDPGILFPNPPGVQCGEGISGWNFVSNTADIQDDHAGIGHGTLVTKTVTSLLEASVIDHQILPIKVFDSVGQGTYWNIVCAMSYLNEIQEKSGNSIRIVNASFGGSLGILEESSTHSLKKEIDRLRETAIVVTSAGNCHFNTDSRLFRHYPSGYSSENILAVGGYDIKDEMIVVHDSSNYGKENIDLATPFNRKLKITRDGTTVVEELSGTSYSAAYTSSLLAKYISANFTVPFDAPQAKKNFLTNESNTESGQFSRCINNGRYIE